MGLYVLTNTVIDVFGGELSFRTGNLFLNVKDNPKGRGYLAKIKRYGQWYPPISGNMLTVRLPIVSK